MKVLIAGAGIGGLVLGVSLLKKGIDVQLFERDMTAIRGEGKYRGPIQVSSPTQCATVPSLQLAPEPASVCSFGRRYQSMSALRGTAFSSGTRWCHDIDFSDICHRAGGLECAHAANRHALAPENDVGTLSTHTHLFRR
jgi:ribulose 1,5-bisphosphate synthetase/thiazole synthase